MSALSAVMLMGMSCTEEARRVAVTITSSSAPSWATAGKLVSAAAIAADKVLVLKSVVLVIVPYLIDVVCKSQLQTSFYFHPIGHKGYANNYRLECDELTVIVDDLQIDVETGGAGNPWKIVEGRICSMLQRAGDSARRAFGDNNYSNGYRAQHA
jgi:hypothetical protein